MVLEYYAWRKIMTKKYRQKLLELVFLIVKSRQLKFNLINILNYWGDPESKSGLGSSNENTENLKKQLLQFVLDHKIERLLDIPCGDFAWMCKFIEKVERKNFTYLGADVATRVIIDNERRFKDYRNISFLVLDLCKDRLPETDLLFVRDCLFHLSNADIADALRNIKRSQFKFVAISAHNVPEDFQNRDIKTGFFRKINIRTSPFNITAQPIMVLDDSSEAEPHKQMLIFRQEDL